MTIDDTTTPTLNVSGDGSRNSTSHATAAAIPTLWPRMANGTIITTAISPDPCPAIKATVTAPITAAAATSAPGPGPMQDTPCV
uniref:Uncharacterized protein n=1 Tax=Octopus bimaculoides TaxID=37653 RepID=A0A0L8H415_OCTBM